MAAAPYRLRCDFLENPLGIDSLRPQLSWLLGDSRPAELQTAWQILAASEPSLLNATDADLWDSGRVPANGSVQVRYGGAALISRQRVWWTVQSFDSDGLPSGYSRPAYFEMGFLEPANWQGSWIGAPWQGSRSLAAPVPMLVRDFSLVAMPKRARLYVAAAGYCRGEINGERLGLGMQAPTAGDYRTRVRYRVLDVTAQLRKGENRLGLLLADGLYAGNIVRGNQRQQFGDRPLLLAQLEVMAADGRLQSICSDQEWSCANSGWLTSDRLLGEHLDARQQQPFWSRSPLGAQEQHDWRSVTVFPGPSGVLSADVGARVQVQERLQSATPTLVLDEWQQAQWRYEFEEVVQGSVEVAAQLEADQRLCINYEGEHEHRDLRDQDSYTGAGGRHQFEALSVSRRFRAVTLSGDLDAAQLPTVTALAQRSFSSLELEFESDCAPLNSFHGQLIKDLQDGALGTLLTGQGTERGLPATAELPALLQVLGRARESAVLLRSWVFDLMDAESRRGDLPRVVPAVPDEPLLRESGSTEALALTVWALYRNYGDLEILHRAYGAVRRLLFVMTEQAPEYIRWATGRTLEAGIPGDLVGTAWFYHCARLATQMAEVLGKTTDQTHFTELAGNIRAAFRRRFVTAEGAVVSRTQTAYCLVLGCGLVNADEQPLAIAGLVTNLRQDGVQVQPGLLTVLLRTLSRNGHLNLAYQLTSTVAGTAELRSRYGQSMVGTGPLEWLYGDLLGITQVDSVSQSQGAYRDTVIAPCLPIGAAFSGPAAITQAWGQCQTMRGAISVGWQLREQACSVQVSLPADTVAELRLPGRAPERLSAGRHERELSLSAMPADDIPTLTDNRLAPPLRYPDVGPGGY